MWTLRVRVLTRLPRAGAVATHQNITFSTLAWKGSYGHDNPSEKTISIIKDKGGLKAGWCCSFGLAALFVVVQPTMIAEAMVEVWAVAD